MVDTASLDPSPSLTMAAIGSDKPGRAMLGATSRGTAPRHVSDQPNGESPSETKEATPPKETRNRVENNASLGTIIIDEPAGRDSVEVGDPKPGN